MSTVADGHVVSFHYTLTDGEGTVVDSSRDRGTPMPYLHGAHNIVPGLERQMVGKGVGDRFDAVVPPAEGYGERQDLPMQAVPRSEFPEDVPVHPGMQLMARDDEGNAMPIWIAKVEGDQIFIDLNHPLAGVTLHFDVEITAIREATEEEMTHGHPHGPEGHAH